LLAQGHLRASQAPKPRSASTCNAASPVLIRMNPPVRSNLSLLGQHDHAHWRLVTARAARPASEGRLQLPDRRITRPADCIQGQARPRLASAAFDLQPAVTAVQALADRWRRLRWASIALHADGPLPSASARSAARAAFLASWRAVSARIFAPMTRPPHMTSRVFVLMLAITASAKALSNPRDLDA
jgi:hypothetical protein